MIHISVNGKTENSAPQSLMDFVLSKGLRPDTVAAELNGALVRRDRWKDMVLKEGDALELISFVGGG